MSLQSIVKVALAHTVIGDALRYAPGLEHAYARYALARRDHPGIFSGLYASYDEAFAAIPKTQVAGWDNEGASTMWTEKVDPIRPSTYPIMFWLSRLLHPDSVLTDLGGSIGLTYYGCRRYEILPPDIRWQVVEMPALAATGRQVAVREAAAGLEFFTELAATPRAEILLSAGALQFMPKSVPGLLEMAGYKPPHLLLNKVPLFAGKGYWTLQNFGPAAAPYQVYNEAEFIGYFEQAGYRLRDRWEVAELYCDIPFHPRQRVREFWGMYWELC
jgi:putative methyltransferase (TIGR04325 family)